MSKDVFVIKKIHAYMITIAVIITIGSLAFLNLTSFPLLNNGNIVASPASPASPDIDAKSSLSAESDIEPVSAEEIYKLFICSCCGRTIDAKCCGMAKEMVNYVDGQVDAGLSKTDVIINTVKKYGLESMVKSKQAEIREEIENRAPDIRPKIVVEPKTYDFGDVSQAKGTVSTLFTVRNNGDAVLVIDDLQTSCGCTTASLEGSPFFGMPGHGGEGASPPGWSYEILPGETAELEVRYDPNMHGDFRGAATRTIYLSSNDPIDFRKGVRIELNQVD